MSGTSDFPSRQVMKPGHGSGSDVSRETRTVRRRSRATWPPSEGGTAAQDVRSWWASDFTRAVNEHSAVSRGGHTHAECAVSWGKAPGRHRPYQGAHLSTRVDIALLRRRGPHTRTWGGGTEATTSLVERRRSLVRALAMVAGTRPGTPPKDHAHGTGSRRQIAAQQPRELPQTRPVRNRPAGQ
jgi:hypothetical protein